MESCIFHKACSPHSSGEHRPPKSKAPLVWHRPRGAVTGGHCQRQSTKEVVKENCRRWSHAFSGPKGVVFAAPRARDPSVLCIHGIQVLGLDDPREQVIPKAEAERGSQSLVMPGSIFLSVPRPPGGFVPDIHPAEGGHKVGDSETNQSCKETERLEEQQCQGPAGRSLLLSAGKEREHPHPHGRKVAFLELCHHQVLTQADKNIEVKSHDSKQDSIPTWCLASPHADSPQ